MTADTAAEFALPAVATDRMTMDVVVEVMRDSAVLPQDARRRTGLQIQADGVTLFSGMAALPPAARRPYRIDGETRLLERVAEQRVAVPAGTQRLHVHGEPGAYVRVLTALNGSPQQVRDAALAEVALRARDDETPDDTYRRALSTVPEPAARAHVLRHGFFLPAAHAAMGDAISTHRLATLRPVAAEDEATAWYADATALATQMGAPTALTWLAAGSGLTLPQEPGAGTPLYRLSVVHPEGEDAHMQDEHKEDVRMGDVPMEGMRRIEFAIRDDQDNVTALTFDPALAVRLSGHRTAQDGLLARQQQENPSIPLVDASQLHVLLPQGRHLVRIENRDPARGVWIAIERHHPAAAAIMPLPGTPGLNALTQALKRDLLGEAATGPASPADDRSTAAAARLITARRAAFEADPCAIVDTPLSRAEAEAALALAERVGSQDPALARCALIRSVAAAQAASPRALSVFRDWSSQQRRPDLLTGLLASRAVRTQAADDWQALAEALRAEAEPLAANWVARIAGLPDAPHPATTPLSAAALSEAAPTAGVRLPPRHSAGSRWLTLSSGLPRRKTAHILCAALWVSHRTESSRDTGI